jgi:hypothetical protein
MVYIISYDQRIVITFLILLILFILKLNVAFLKALHRFVWQRTCWSTTLCS